MAAMRYGVFVLRKDRWAGRVGGQWVRGLRFGSELQRVEAGCCVGAWKQDGGGHDKQRDCASFLASTCFCGCCTQSAQAFRPYLTDASYDATCLSFSFGGGWRSTACMLQRGAFPLDRTCAFCVSYLHSSNQQCRLACALRFRLRSTCRNSSFVVLHVATCTASIYV